MTPTASKKNTTSKTTLYEQAHSLVLGVPDILIKAEKIANVVTQGGHAKRVHGASDLFWQYAPYTSDQDAKRIDWRQSAKSDHLYIREKEKHNAQNYAFWVSNGKSMDFASHNSLMTKSNAAQCLSLALSIILSRQHEIIGALGHKPYGHDQTAIRKLLNHFQTNSTSLPEQQARLRKNTTCILSGDFLLPIKAIEQSFAPIAAQTHSGILFHVFDPAEITLPYKGRIKFEDSESNDTLINHAQGIRDAYIEKLQTHCKNIESLCHTYGWQYIRYTTDMDMANTLIKTLIHFNNQKGQK